MVGNFYTRAATSVINSRSVGIQDLSHGYLLDEDWQQNKVRKVFKQPKSHVPCYDHVHYYGIAGSLTENPSGLVARYLGDGMVHPKTASALDLKHFVVLPKTHHRALTTSDAVYRQIYAWLKDS